MLKVEVHGSNPVSQLLQILRQLPHANIPTVCLSAGVVALVLLLHRFVPRFPGALLAVVGAVAASAAFDFSGHSIQVVGVVAGGLPHPSIPFAELGPCSPLASSRGILLRNDHGSKLCHSPSLRRKASPGAR